MHNEGKVNSWHENISETFTVALPWVVVFAAVADWLARGFFACEAADIVLGLLSYLCVLQALTRCETHAMVFGLVGLGFSLSFVPASSGLVLLGGLFVAVMWLRVVGRICEDSLYVSFGVLLVSAVWLVMVWLVK